MANPKPFLKKMLKINAGKKKTSAPMMDGYQTQTTPSMEKARKLRKVLQNNPYPRQ